MNEWAVMWETLVNSGVSESEATRRVQAAQNAAQAEQSQDWANMWERLVDAGVPEQGATQRVLQAQRTLSAPDRRAAAGDAVNSAMAAGDTATARVIAEGMETRVPVERPVSSGAGRTWEPSPRAAGRAFGEERGPVGAFSQGVGSFVFGVGTPIAATDEMLRSRIRGEPRTWEESVEFARGLRETSAEEHPVAYGIGAVTGLVGSGGLVRQAIKRLPAKAQSVFNLQEGQTVRNLARMSAAGGTAAGVTAAVQEENVPAAAAAGAVLGPVVGGIVGGGVRAAQWAHSKIKPDNAVIRLLSKRLGETADEIADRYNDFVSVMRRRPRLIEIMRREGAEEMGQVATSKVGVEASRVFREAEEASALARPRELRTVIERGGRTTTLPAEQSELAAIADEGRAMVGRNAQGRVTSLGGRVTSVESDQISRRDVVMDRVMNRIGNHRVPLSDDMRDVLDDPDVQTALGPALRRRVNNAIEQGKTIGTIDLSIRTWEMMRQALASKADAGSGKIYSRLRDKVRDYVSERVPEYGRALREFGRRSEMATATTAAKRTVSGDAHEFAGKLRATLGDAGEHRASALTGSRAGVRSWLANQLDGPSRQAAFAMERLARDNRLRSNLRNVLSRNEMIELEALGERYGHRLNIIEGVKVGQRVVPVSDSERFADAAREAGTRRGGEIGVRTGARGALAGRAGESPGAAVGVASALAENPGFQQRIATALGGREAARLQAVGAMTTRAAQNLAVATPRATEAQLRRQAEAQAIQEVITGGVAATGRAPGALYANLLNDIQQRMRMSKGVAKRMAEMAVDPNRAHIFIAQMRRAGVAAEELQRLYRDAAVAAGITVGAN